MAIDEFDNASTKIFEIEVSDIPIKRAKFYALMIGVDKYRNGWGSIRTCISDCRDVAKVLTEKYGFEIDTLFDNQATRSGILDKIDALKTKTMLDSNSNVLIYFSGHGKAEDNTAYWIPSDAGQSSSGWVSTADISSKIFTISKRVKHSLLVSDACYSGVMLSKSSIDTAMLFVNHFYEKASSDAITSGGNKEVPQQSSQFGCAANSPFGCALKKALSTNNKPFVRSSAIYTMLSTEISTDKAAIDLQQTPQYGFLGQKSAGDFIFINQKSIVQPQQTAKSKSSTSQTIKAIITTSKSMIYSSPDGSTITKMYLIKGDEVKILETNGEWLQVRYYNTKKSTNISGWILKSDVQ